jgi:hypothetical protein
MSVPQVYEDRQAILCKRLNVEAVRPVIYFRWLLWSAFLRTQDFQRWWLSFPESLLPNQCFYSCIDYNINFRARFPSERLTSFIMMILIDLVVKGMDRTLLNSTIK